MPTTEVETILVPIDETFTPIVDSIAARLADMGPAYALVYDEFLDIERKRFSSEGPGWQQLKTSTVAKRGSAHPILHDTGELEDSLTDAGHTNAVFEPEIDSVFMGTSDPVAIFHQEGTDKMVARPVVDMTEADAASFAGIIGDYLFSGPGGTVSAGGALFAAGALGL